MLKWLLFQAASGIPQMAPGNYMQPGQPMYYPGAQGGYPGPAGRGMPQMGMRGYPQPMQGRFPGQMPNMPPMPYPQGYPAYPGGGRGVSNLDRSILIEY